MAPETKLKVVVIEDDPKLRKFLEVLLTSENFVVYSASDGEEGVDLVRALLPDVALLDVMLPIISGLDLLRRMRSDPVTANIPCIFLSAKATIDDRVAGLSSGADDYVIKPFAPAELVLRIKAVLRRAGLKPPGGPPPQPAHGFPSPTCSVGRELKVAKLFAGAPEIMLAGQLSAVTLIDVLQSISGSGMTGSLEICASDHAVLELRNGQIIHAQVNNPRTEIRGLKAWFRMACWTGGAFEFLEVDSSQEPARTIDTPLQNLLMDAAYYRDEVLRVRGLFPPINFELLQQNAPKMDAEFIDHAVYQAVGNGIGLEPLLDALDYSDLEILQSCARLMTAGNLGLRLSMF